MKEKTILLFVAGLVLTIVVIVGAILFIPGKTYSYYEIDKVDKVARLIRLRTFRGWRGDISFLGLL